MINKLKVKISTWWNKPLSPFWWGFVSVFDGRGPFMTKYSRRKGETDEEYEYRMAVLDFDSIRGDWDRAVEKVVSEIEDPGQK